MTNRSSSTSSSSAVVGVAVAAEAVPVPVLVGGGHKKFLRQIISLTYGYALPWNFRQRLSWMLLEVYMTNIKSAHSWCSQARPWHLELASCARHSARWNVWCWSPDQSQRPKNWNGPRCLNFSGELPSPTYPTQWEGKLIFLTALWMRYATSRKKKPFRKNKDRPKNQRLRSGVTI